MNTGRRAAKVHLVSSKDFSCDGDVILSLHVRVEQCSTLDLYDYYLQT